MKKIIIIFLFILSGSVFAQREGITLTPVPVIDNSVVSDTANLARLNRNQTFTGKNIFTQFIYPLYDTVSSDGAGGSSGTVTDSAQISRIRCENFAVGGSAIIRITYNNTAIVASTAYILSVNFPLNALSPFMNAVAYYNSDGVAFIEIASGAPFVITDIFYIVIQLINLP